jgi:hypothetical protein
LAGAVELVNFIMGIRDSSFGWGYKYSEFSYFCSLFSGRFREILGQIASSHTLSNSLFTITISLDVVFSEAVSV